MKQAIWFLSAVAAVGCVTDDFEATVPAERAISPVENVHVRAHDCVGGIDVFAPNRGTLHVVGIGQALEVERPHYEMCDGRGCEATPARIHVGRGVETLVLASPLATRWKVTADPGSDLRTVIVSGRRGENPSSAIAPKGVEIAKVDLGYAYAYQKTDCETALEIGACTDDKHRRWQMRETKLFLDSIEEQTGEQLGTFHGCEQMSSMSIGTDSLDAVGSRAVGRTLQPASARTPTAIVGGTTDHVL